jgi:hypothetical protein
MAGKIRTFWSVMAEYNGTHRTFGSMVRRFKEALFGDNTPLDVPFELPQYDADAPADPTLLLTYEQWLNFALVLVLTEDEHGVFELYEVCDAESSPTDATPAETSERVNQWEVNCLFPQAIHLPTRRVHATLAVANGIDGDGRPLLATDAGTIAGRAHRWYAFNRDATKTIKIRLICFPK